MQILSLMDLSSEGTYLNGASVMKNERFILNQSGKSLEWKKTEGCYCLDNSMLINCKRLSLQDNLSSPTRIYFATGMANKCLTTLKHVRLGSEMGVLFVLYLGHFRQSLVIVKPSGSVRIAPVQGEMHSRHIYFQTMEIYCHCCAPSTTA